MTVQWLLPYRGQRLVPEFEVQLRASGQFVRCLARRVWVRMGPEEEVRQSVLSFLLRTACGQNRWSEFVELRVAYGDMDIAVLGRPRHSDYRPSVVLLVIETKRPNTNLSTPQVEAQLQRYLRRERCSEGILIDGRTCVLHRLDQGKCTKVALHDLMELEMILQHRIDYFNAKTRMDLELFFRAQDGDVSALLELAGRLPDRITTFVLHADLRGGVASVRAWGLRAHGSLLRFYERGVESKYPYEVEARNFRGLVRVQSW